MYKTIEYFGLPGAGKTTDMKQTIKVEYINPFVQLQMEPTKNKKINKVKLALSVVNIRNFYLLCSLVAYAYKTKVKERKKQLKFILILYIQLLFIRKNKNILKASDQGIIQSLSSINFNLFPNKESTNKIIRIILKFVNQKVEFRYLKISREIAMEQMIERETNKNDNYIRAFYLKEIEMREYYKNLEIFFDNVYTYLLNANERVILIQK